MRRYSAVRGDSTAAALWMWIAVLAVVFLVVGLAFYVMAAGPPPSMNEPTEDTRYVISIAFNFKYRNLPGGWHAPEADREFDVRWEDYKESKDYPDADRSVAAVFELMFLEEDEHRFTLDLEVSNAQGFLIDESWEQDVHIGETSKVDVSFGTKYCFVEDDGLYTVKAKVHVYAPEESVLTGPIPWITDRKVDDTIWTLTKTIKVG